MSIQCNKCGHRNVSIVRTINTGRGTSFTIDIPAARLVMPEEGYIRERFQEMDAVITEVALSDLIHCTACAPSLPHGVAWVPAEPVLKAFDQEDVHLNGTTFEDHTTGIAHCAMRFDRPMTTTADRRRRRQAKAMRQVPDVIPGAVIDLTARIKAEVEEGGRAIRRRLALDPDALCA